jgi:hypothetical protein
MKNVINHSYWHKKNPRVFDSWIFDNTSENVKVPNSHTLFNSHKPKPHHSFEFIIS